MVDSIEFDLIICGSGLAGLRAAIAAAKKGPNPQNRYCVKITSNAFSLCFCRRWNCCSYFEDEGDTIESHVYDTVKGSDFLADQDVAERLCVEMPQEIHQLDHWGMPWSRKDNGRIDQRNFGDVIVFQEQLVSDKVGFFEMQTLYDTCQKHENIEYLNEWFATSIVHDGKKFMGLTAIELGSGTFYNYQRKSIDRRNRWKIV